MTLPPELYDKKLNSKHYYKGGVFIPPTDLKCTRSANQYATIVGFDIPKKEETDAYLNCSGYWIVRLPLGKDFGENGHIRLCIMKDKPNDTVGTCKV